MFNTGLRSSISYIIYIYMVVTLELGWGLTSNDSNSHQAACMCPDSKMGGGFACGFVYIYIIYILLL